MAKKPIQHEYIGDWDDRAVDLLPSAYDSSENLKGLVRALGHGVQQLEDEIAELVFETPLETANSDALEKWGALVGEKRGSFNDRVYRKFIHGRIRANRTDGAADSMIKIYEFLTETSDVYYYDHYPAAFRLDAIRESFMGEHRRMRVKKIMEVAKPGGVGMTLVEAIRDGTNRTGVGINGPLARTL